MTSGAVLRTAWWLMARTTRTINRVLPRLPRPPDLLSSTTLCFCHRKQPQLGVRPLQLFHCPGF